MALDAEAVGNGLEDFLFFVDAGAFAPPPRLVHKRPMRRVHQADNAVVHTARQLGLQVFEPIVRAESWQARGFGRFLISVVRIGYKDPEIAVLLFALEASGKNSINFELVTGRQRRDELALPCLSFENPPVIRTLH